MLHAEFYKNVLKYFLLEYEAREAVNKKNARNVKKGNCGKCAFNISNLNIREGMVLVLALTRCLRFVIWYRQCLALTYTQEL
jgi:hypothetical protein